MSISRRTFVAAGAAALLAACTAGRKKAAAPRAPTTAAGSTAAPPSTAPQAPPTTAAGPTGPARFVDAGPATATTVALTFHGSGDPALTDQLLAIAERLKAPITVFAVGQWLETNGSMAAKILAAGHELANHTYTHPALATKARAVVATEIRQCRDVLTRQTGSNGTWFRPSGIEGRPPATVLEEAGAAGYPVVVGFDVDPLDYQDPGADAIVARTAAKLKGGSIVSLHLGHAGTVAAFERIVTGARAKHLEPVVVTALIGGH
ncbi:MAG: hypothetical protein QOG64_1076 [Acidimicrobiaceae bacterium]|nr:hypothetical protein [Acidimicrobiaceae bacterium]